MNEISFAQNQRSEHLTFKSVPIDGTLAEYVSKMKQNSFTHISTENETASLKGDFAGYKDCMIEVSILKQKDLVHKISAIFPNRETWLTLIGNYSDLKEMLTGKYGKPSDFVENFDGGYPPKDDRMKLSLLAKYPEKTAVRCFFIVKHHRKLDDLKKTLELKN